jgi:hypothetical protein
MVRWMRGQAEIEALIASGDLQKLTGAAANGERFLKKAVVTLETARSAVERDPDSAIVLAYDAARQALTALLAHQGLRPTTKRSLCRSAGCPGTVRPRVPSVRRPAKTSQRTGVPRASR